MQRTHCPLVITQSHAFNPVLMGKTLGGDKSNVHSCNKHGTGSCHDSHPRDPMSPQSPSGLSEITQQREVTAPRLSHKGQCIARRQRERSGERAGRRVGSGCGIQWCRETTEGLRTEKVRGPGSPGSSPTVSVLCFWSTAWPSHRAKPSSNPPWGAGGGGAPRGCDRPLACLLHCVPSCR